MWELLLRMILDTVAENMGVQVEFYNRFQYTVEVSGLSLSLALLTPETGRITVGAYFPFFLIFLLLFTIIRYCILANYLCGIISIPLIFIRSPGCSVPAEESPHQNGNVTVPVF